MPVGKLPFILFIDDWWAESTYREWCPIWAGGPRYCKKAAEQTMRSKPVKIASVSAPASMFLPFLCLGDRLQVKLTLSSPGWLWYFIMAIEISGYSPSGSFFSCGLLLVCFLLFSIEGSIISLLISPFPCQLINVVFPRSLLFSLHALHLKFCSLTWPQTSKLSLPRASTSLKADKFHLLVFLVPCKRHPQHIHTSIFTVITLIPFKAILSFYSSQKCPRYPCLTVLTLHFQPPSLKHTFFVI